VRKFAAVLVVGGALAWAAPAGAGQSNAGCQVYGQTVAATVQANVPAGAVVSVIATSGPGVLPAFVEGFKLGTCT
jgi:hypothetical protein